MSKINNTDQLPDIPWKHMWSVDQLDKGRVTLTIQPEPNLYESLAAFLDIKALKALSCAYVIRRKDGGHMIHVHGEIKSEVEQICVQSLEPMVSEINEAFDGYFADRGQAVPFSKAKKELYSKYGVDDTPILEEEEDPELIENGHIDIGALAIQFLSLAIDPYPRRDGLESQLPDEVSIATTAKFEERENPFAALKDLKRDD